MSQENAEAEAASGCEEGSVRTTLFRFPGSSGSCTPLGADLPPAVLEVLDAVFQIAPVAGGDVRARDLVEQLREAMKGSDQRAALMIDQGRVLADGTQQNGPLHLLQGNTSASPIGR